MSIFICAEGLGPCVFVNVTQNSGWAVLKMKIYLLNARAYN